MSRGIEVISSG